MRCAGVLHRQAREGSARILPVLAMRGYSVPSCTDEAWLTVDGKRGEREMNRRRELSKEYKERTVVGGVYTITNTSNGKYLIGHAANLASVRNRFDFAVSTGSAVDPRVRTDWAEFGAGAFRLDVLEELEQQADQTPAEFMDDLVTLETLLRAGLDPAKAY